MCREELEALFRGASVGAPLDGTYKGLLVYLVDERLNAFKLRMAEATWRGKAACAETGYFGNRFAADVRWNESYYEIGPSWIDGKPAICMEYTKRALLFWNMHDEVREIAPGLYLGPVIERFPCPHFRGYVALQKECDKDCKPFGPTFTYRISLKFPPRCK
jgi:hypothetical protein